MATRIELTRDGVRLSCLDFGGTGQPVLLLHGLAGHAEEWAQTASWLTARCRVVAPDARGHGRSERFPGDVSRAAAAADAAFVVERLGLAPVVAVGQSLGGLTALALAGARPDLVCALVLVDAHPADGEGAEEAAVAVAGALREWPAAYRSRAEADAFFAQRFGPGLAAEAWTNGLEHADGMWRPRFDVDVLAGTLLAALSVPGWEEWDAVACPTLVVRAGNGVVAPATVVEMARRRPDARMAEIPGAAHDLHLDHPDEWRAALTAFLEAAGFWS